MDVQVKLHFKLTSEHDLQEIKLGISRQNHIYTPPSYVLTKDDGLSINSNARPFQEHKIESLRNSYDVVTFAAGDFIQKRVGKEIYVEIRLPEKIGDVAIPGQERLVRKSFFHFPRTLKTNLVIGKSSSLRTVSHVEFVDTKLNSTNVVPKTPWTYQIKSENHESANPYVNMSEETWKRYWSAFSDINDEAESSCSNLFKN